MKGWILISYPRFVALILCKAMSFHYWHSHKFVGSHLCRAHSDLYTVGCGNSTRHVRDVVDSYRTRKFHCLLSYLQWLEGTSFHRKPLGVLHMQILASMHLSNRRVSMTSFWVKDIWTIASVQCWSNIIIHSHEPSVEYPDASRLTFGRMIQPLVIYNV